MIPLFAGLFFLSLLSIKTQKSPVYEQWVLNALSPVTDFFSWTSKGVRKSWNHYFYLVGASQERDLLQAKLSSFGELKAHDEGLRLENERLKNLLDMKQKNFPKAIAARVMAFDPRSEFKSIRIDKGSRQGIAPDMPVVASGGLVGKVGPVFKDEAYVLLIVDPASFVDCLVNRSRVRGLLAGSGTIPNTDFKPGFLTRLEYLKRESDIQAGDSLITSGLDRLYPKGILVGEVQTVDKDPLGLFQKAKVVPSVDFSGLEEVLILRP